MHVYTYSMARQNLSNLLDQAIVEGNVVIKRKDGCMFSVKPFKVRKRSPLDVKGVNTDLTSKEIVRSIHEGRRP